MTALDDRDQRRALCAGIDPRTMYEDAWNDKTGRPAPGLAKALAICEACPIREACMVAGLDEPWGIWGGTVPPERGQVRGIRYATDADPLDIIYRLGETAMSITDLGEVILTPDATDPDREPVEGIPSMADIDQAYKEAWADAAKAAGGSYLDVPPEVRDRLSEDHRRAHVERVDAEKKAQAKKAAAAKKAQAALCPAGHDLTGYLVSGKPVLTPTGQCRLCNEAA